MQHETHPGYEKRNSLRTGEPENSGFSSMQLGGGLTVRNKAFKLKRAANKDSLQKVLQPGPPLLQEARPEL